MREKWRTEGRTEEKQGRRLRFSAVLRYLPSPEMEGRDSLCCLEIYYPQRKRAEIHCYVPRSGIATEKRASIMAEIHPGEHNLLLMIDRATEGIKIQKVDGRWSIMRQKPTGRQSSEIDEGE
ncbi:hypothetical protein MRB53_022979 [Persea americana]|uniref:Uncharacterized protein n=1 Tax=Persea americana TaxID=3435 RepID=A0ACC2L8A5_PERAE|nr:hypothetical protein MRB53_022979 [Persea americana]